MLARITRAKFARGAAVLVSGAVGAQLATAIASPLLTRLYGPDQIGLLGLFMAFVSVGSIAASLRYEQAIVVPERPSIAARLFMIALGLVVPTTVLSTAILILLVAADLSGYGDFPSWAILLAALTLLTFGVSSAARYWLIRIGRFDVVAGVVVAQSLGRGIAQVSLGALGAGVLGLFVGELLGRVVGMTRMLRIAWPTVSDARKEYPATPLRRVAAEYAQFPLAGVPSSLLNSLAFHLPTPLLAAAFGLPVAGFFALVQRVLGLPLSVIGASVADALLARIAEHARMRPDRAMHLFRVTALALLGISVPLNLVVILAGPSAFVWIFGSEWQLAGMFAAVMAPWYTAALVVSPLSRVVLVYRGQVSKLVYDILSLAVAVGSISLAVSRDLDALSAVWFLSLGQAAAYGVYLIILYRLVQRATRPSGDARVR